MSPPKSQIPPVRMRIETELPVWPTEKYRQNGTHLHYRRRLSSSIPIDDLAKLPGNTEELGLISSKLLIIKIDGGGRSLERTVLPMHFPANREINREIAEFAPMFGVNSADKPQMSRAE
jgi:hypothetical protein